MSPTAKPPSTPREDRLNLLRRVALTRTRLHGGTVSISAVVQTLVDAARDDLEVEAAR